MKTCQTVDAVYEQETLHPLTPLQGLKNHEQVRIQVWTLDEPENTTKGLAAILGGWAGSEELALTTEKVYLSRTGTRQLSSE
jgi:hypothetical protein